MISCYFVATQYDLYSFFARQKIRPNSQLTVSLDIFLKFGEVFELASLKHKYLGESKGGCKPKLRHTELSV